MKRTLFWCLFLLSAARPSMAAIQDGDRPHPVARSAEDEAALKEERAECDRLVRRGEAASAVRRMSALLEEDPHDAGALLVRAHARLDRADYGGAMADADQALVEWKDRPEERANRADALRTWADAACTIGRAGEAAARLDAARADLDPTHDARDAWAAGRALWISGQRKLAIAALEAGAASGIDQPWDALVARGQCQRRLGRLEPASESLIAALEVSKRIDGEEPDALVALADLYFEADREVERAKRRSAADLYWAALERHASHEGALLGLFALHRYNWQRQRASAEELMGRALATRPHSVEALLAAAGADIDDGQQKSARQRVATLVEIAPARRELRTLRAAIAYIDRDGDRCEKILAELAAEDPKDSGPEREVGRHLVELYRFSEGLPFLKRAAERDPADWEALTYLGRALANTGDEKAAREALDRAEEAAQGRQDAWRDNTRLVLKRIQERHGTRTEGELTFSWESAGDEVLAAYLVPFYTEARAELGRRYGFTPTPTEIEVFRNHKDFSVRSTGFEGFPALGVCFGPVVTAVSPLWEMRGTQSWARTSFHEFTHVIHLGLSHNRCPRWITEGLATWEEVHRNPAWTRNMRRELLDDLACGDVIKTREMNRAFRGPRILFGYYQAGLMCQMLIDRAGFPPIVRLLEAFDRGLDLDAALQEVYATTPEDLDRDFDAWARALTANLRVEPRWSAAYVARLSATLPAKPPVDPAARSRWADDRVTLAFGAWQQRRKIDAQELLRTARIDGADRPRAVLLRAEIALSDGDRDKARQLYEAFLATGLDDYRARIALAGMAHDAGDKAAAERHLLAAEKDFPGWDDPELSAELRLTDLYWELDRKDDAEAAKERWLAWNAGEVKRHREVAAWHLEAGRPEPALRLLAEANEVDPFLRGLHREWGDALRAAGRHAEALREYRSAILVPAELDAERPAPYTDVERAELIALQAASLEALGQKSEALDRAKEALALDHDCKIARETLERVQ